MQNSKQKTPEMGMNEMGMYLSFYLLVPGHLYPPYFLRSLIILLSYLLKTALPEHSPTTFTFWEIFTF